MRKIKPVLTTALAALAALALPQQLMAQDAAATLRPYYAELRRSVELPLAPPGPALEQSAVLTRIAFGSCDQQARSQQIWSQIAAQQPQLFMMIGDNVYGDTGWTGDAGLASLRTAYATLAAREEFRDFRAKVPMLTVWDDHDFGINDGGRNYVFREWSEAIFEHFWNASLAVRSRPGVYDSAIFGPRGRRVQIVMLDTRFFRSPIKMMPWQQVRPPLGTSMPDDSSDASVLGDEQWRWLEAELARPAELRLIVSSIQVLTTAHHFESWSNFSGERSRLLTALGRRQGGALLLLSGDRHSGATYSLRSDHGARGEETPGEELWEITSSSLNSPMGADMTDIEPDPLRRSRMIGAVNFGLIEIDWKHRKLGFSVRGGEGERLAEHELPLALR